MCSLRFILLLLIPSYISGGCQSNISVSGGQNICSGQYFNLTCQFACHEQQNHVKLVKDKQILRRVESSNNSITLFIQVHSANKNNSGTYNCQTEPMDSISMAYLIVEDCAFPSQSSSSSSSSSSPLATAYQSPTPSRILAPVLIWYILFKTGVFLIGSITAALKVRSTKK